MRRQTWRRTHVTKPPRAASRRERAHVRSYTRAVLASPQNAGGRV